MTFPIKHLFDLPEGIIYLDGNSLGPLPKGAGERAMKTIEQEWGIELIRAWNSCNWMDMPRIMGDRIAPLIGAVEGTVATGDTLSIKVYQALAAALKMRPDRKVILSDKNNFPSDLYMAEGLIKTLDGEYKLQIVDGEELYASINDDVAALLWTQVDYRSGKKYNMDEVTQWAHKEGAVMIWDLAHSAGAVEVDLTASKAEFAVGCTYKFLNGGPGAPAFIYVRPDLIETIEPALSGWLGHDAPFAMENTYRPAMSTQRMRIGTPPILQLSVLNCALDIFDGLNLADLQKASIELSETFIAEVERQCPMLKLASPRDPQCRGSHVSFCFDEGYAAIQALIEHGVIGDFRAPNIMRFGITPLYLDKADIVEAAKRIGAVMNGELWDHERFKKRSMVT